MSAGPQRTPGVGVQRTFALKKHGINGAWCMSRFAVLRGNQKQTSRKLQGTSQPLCQVFKMRSCLTRDMEAPHWLLSKKLPTHPPLRAETPSASHGGQEKYGSWMRGCTADRAAGVSSQRTCQKRPHLLLGSWKRNPPCVSSSDVILSMHVYAVWGWKMRGPCVP